MILLFMWNALKKVWLIGGESVWYSFVSCRYLTCSMQVSDLLDAGIWPARCGYLTCSMQVSDWPARCRYLTCSMQVSDLLDAGIWPARCRSDTCSMQVSDWPARCRYLTCSMQVSDWPARCRYLTCSMQVSDLLDAGIVLTYQSTLTLDHMLRCRVTERGES